MNHLFRKIVTIYAFTVFIVTALLYPIPIAIFYRLVWPKDEKRKLQYHTILCHYFRWCGTHVPFVSINADLTEKQFEKPSVIICNHQSHLDLLTFLMMSPRVVAMTNQWVWHFPLYAPVIRYCEFYPAADGLESNEEKIKSLLERGYSVLIFPEGTRSAECKILKFHRGAFYLAERLDADIQPVYLDSPGRCLPKKDFTLCPGKIDVHFGSRIAHDDTSMGENYREKTRAWHQYYIKWENEILS